MATIQISLIQHRYGQSSELPDSLEHAELGFIEDTGELVIGAPNNSLVINRQQAGLNIYPYQNIRILTEFSNLGDYFKYKAIIDEDDSLHMAFILVGNDVVTTLTLGSVLTINGVDVALTSSGVLLNDAITAINAAGIAGINAINLDGKIGIINYSSNDLILSNHTHSPLTSLKISTNSTETYPSLGTFERTINDVLDDRISIRSFGAVGNLVNISNIIHSAAISLYKDDTKTLKLKQLYFPAGEYNLESNFFPLIKNMSIVGDGMDRTIIKGSLSSLINVIDTNGNNNNSPDFGDGELPSNIVVDGFTFKNIDDSVVLDLNNIEDVVFTNCKFYGSGNVGSVLVRTSTTSIIKTVKFINCVFENAEYGMRLEHNCQNITISDCIFKNISKEAVYLNGDGALDTVDYITIKDSVFDTVSLSVSSPIFIGVVINSKVTNNKFINVLTSYKCINISNTTIIDTEEYSGIIAPTFTPELIELDTEDTTVIFDYIIGGVGHQRVGKLVAYIDSSIPDTNPIVISDNNASVSAEFTAIKTTDGFKLLITNASADNIFVRYTYRIV